MRRYKVPVTTAADGSATAYTPRVAGLLHAIHYVKTDFADGVDFAISSEVTGESLWAESNVNAAAVRYPRAPTHSQAGAAARLRPPTGDRRRMIGSRSRATASRS